jgi:hypothetical protein
MTPATDYAFDVPVLLRCASGSLIRTVEEAACILRSRMRERFTMEGLNTLLMLERAAQGDEIEEARHAFCSWALHERLT